MLYSVHLTPVMFVVLQVLFISDFIECIASIVLSLLLLINYIVTFLMLLVVNEFYFTVS